MYVIILTGRMVANLKMHYSEKSREWMLLNKAAFLDPLFSRLVLLSPEQRNLVSNSLSQEMKKMSKAMIIHKHERKKSHLPLVQWGACLGTCTN